MGDPDRDAFFEWEVQVPKRIWGRWLMGVGVDGRRTVGTTAITQAEVGWFDGRWMTWGRRMGGGCEVRRGWIEEMLMMMDRWIISR